MKKIHLLFPLLWPAFTIGQDFNQHLIGTTGAYNENANAALSWSIGETMVETFASSSYTLTQGFQQGSLSVTALINQPGFETDINVYPNPVESHLTIEADLHGAQYSIVNMQGKVVKTGRITKSALQIDFSALPNDTYLLQVNKQNTHKIIKQ